VGGHGSLIRVFLPNLECETDTAGDTGKQRLSRFGWKRKRDHVRCGSRSDSTTTTTRRPTSITPIMPQPISNLSRHHIPDISETDASLSFEIPCTVDSADLLLANKSDDFLNGVDCSLTTPPPPKRTLDVPLTLSELTPTHRTAQVQSVKTPPPSLRRRTSTKSPETLRARPSAQKTPQSFVSSRLNMIKLADSPVSAKRFANLQAEVDSLGRDSMEEVQHLKPTVPQIEATNSVVAPLKGELNLPKGGEHKPRTKPVRLRVTFHCSPELISMN
jgi:hypothetical protein